MTLWGCRQSAPWGTHVVAVANHKCRLPGLCLASPLQGKLDLNLPALFLGVATFLSRRKKPFLCQPSWLWGAHLFLPEGCWRQVQGPAGVAQVWPVTGRTDDVARARRHCAVGRGNSRRVSHAGATRRSPLRPTTRATPPWSWRRLRRVRPWHQRPRLPLQPTRAAAAESTPSRWPSL